MSNEKENVKDVPPRYEEIGSHKVEQNPEKVTLKDKLNQLASIGKQNKKKQDEELLNKINIELDNLFPTIEQLEEVAKTGKNMYIIFNIKHYAKYSCYYFLNKTKGTRQININAVNQLIVLIH